MTVDLVALALDVTLITCLDLELLGDLGGQRLGRIAGKCSNPGIADIRAGEQLGGAHLAPQRLAEDTLGERLIDPLGTYEGLAQALALALDRLALVLETTPLHIADQPEPPARLGQAQVGVVLAQHQPILGATGEHPIGLGRSARDEIVDHDAEIGLVATRQPGVAALHRKGCVDAGEQALRRGLLVAGRPVDLAGEIEALNITGLQGRLEIARIEEVVLDRIARAGDVRLLETNDRAHQRLLDIKGQAGGDAVRIDLMGLEPLGLDEDLMRRLLGEAHHLVLDRGTIARSDTGDDARIERRAREARMDDLVGPGVGMGDITAHLPRVILCAAHVGEDRHGHVARLLGQARKIDAPPVDARRRARLEPLHTKRQLAQAPRECIRRWIAGASALIVGQSDMDATAQEGPDREHDCMCPKAQPHLSLDADHPVLLDQEVFDRLLKECEPGLVLDRRAHRGLIEDAVGLGTCRPHRRSLAGVEDAKLDTAAIRRACHQAAERIDLLDQMTLADTPDGRVTAHLADGFDILGQKERAQAAAGRRKRRFGARVTAAHHHHVVRIADHHEGKPKSMRPRSLTQKPARIPLWRCI